MNKQHSKYTFKGHGSAIVHLDLSTDGRKMVSVGSDHRAILWDLEAATALNVTFLERFGYFEHPCVFPDASKIATATAIRETSTGAVIRGYREGGVLACSLDGRLLVRYKSEVCSRGRRFSEIRIIDSRTGRTRHKLDMRFATYDSSYRQSFAFSPDGAFLAFLGRDSTEHEMADGLEVRKERSVTAYIYDLKSKTLVAKSSEVDYAKLFWTSSSVSRLVAIDHDGSRIWNAETGELIEQFPKPGSSHLPATLSPDGTLLARMADFEYWCIEVFSVLTAKRLWREERDRGWIRALAFTSDSHWLASAGDDQAILIRDAVTGERVQTLRAHMPRVEALSFTPEGEQLSAIYDDGSVRLWNVEPRTLEKWETASPQRLEFIGRKTAQITRHYWSLPFHKLPLNTYENPYVSIQSVSPDGSLVALQYPRYEKYVPEREDEEGEVESQSAEVETTSLEERLAMLSPQDRTLYDACINSPSSEFTIIWSVETQSVLCLLPSAENGRCVIFPDNRRCAISVEKSVIIYSIETGEALQRFETGDFVKADLTLSPDGNLLAAVMQSFAVWDTGTGKQVDLNEDIFFVDDNLFIAFYPDGKRVITSFPHYFTHACVHQFPVGKELLSLEGHLDSVRAVACSPDSKLVATGAQDGAVKVWDATSGALLATYQALPEAEAWVVHTPEGEVTGSPGAEAYLMENIEREK